MPPPVSLLTPPAQVTEKFRRRANELRAKAKQDAEDITSRHREAVEITHKAEVDKIRTTLLADLRTQDALLETAWTDLLALEKDFRGGLERFAGEIAGGVKHLQEVQGGYEAVVRKHGNDAAKGCEDFEKTVGASGVNMASATLGR